jgi:hypothetical protein
LSSSFCARVNVEQPQSKHTQALGNVKRSGMGLVGYHAVVTAIQADELNATSDEAHIPAQCVQRRSSGDDHGVELRS